MHLRDVNVLVSVEQDDVFLEIECSEIVATVMKTYPYLLPEILDTDDVLLADLIPNADLHLLVLAHPRAGNSDSASINLVKKISRTNQVRRH